MFNPGGAKSPTIRPPKWQGLMRTRNKDPNFHIKTRPFVNGGRHRIHTRYESSREKAMLQRSLTAAAPQSIISRPFSIATLPHSLFKQCNSLAAAKLLHLQVLVHGLLSRRSHDLFSAYISANAPSHALSLLQLLPLSPNSLPLWNALIRSFVGLSLLRDSLRVYSKMRRLGISPDCYTLPFVLKAAGEIPSFRLGASVHGSVVAFGLDSNVFVCNALVSMYGRFGDLGGARKVFDEMSVRGVYDRISWNSIVAAYGQNGRYADALELFGRMNWDSGGHRPDPVSLVNVLPACAALGRSMQGKEIHGFAVRRLLMEDVFVGNALVDQYAKVGMMEEANRVFMRMRVKDVVSWNAMVTGFSHAGRFEEALNLIEEMKKEKIDLNIVTWSAVIAGFAQRERGYEAMDVFRQMKLSGLEPNVITLVSLLSGCASVGALLQGKEIHCYSIKRLVNTYKGDLEGDLMIINGLIDMYCKCKEFQIARTMLNLVPSRDRNVVTWTVMIGGLAQHGEANESLQLFSEMMKTSVTPNAFTISCVLLACARLGALRIGKEVHAYVLRHGFEHEVLFVANCLVDMYSKSGDVQYARLIFESMKERNAVSWTSLMAGYGMHGLGEEALQIFDEMRTAGLAPDAVTFVVVLYACSHSGLTDRGIKYFYSMSEEFGVARGVEHYACMVDLLGRAGRLDEAMKLIEEMPMEPSSIVWVAVLNACRLHAHVELGEYAVQRLSQMDSQNDGTYTLLSNIYASARRWKDVARIRLLMKNSGVNKRPGCSWVQGVKGTETFYAGDWSHPLSGKIYEVLSDLIQRIKGLGYVPETSFALHDVDEEEKGDLLLEHSEKLALAYAILTSAVGATIRITKNLRVCGDCHNAFVYISKVVEHEIIVRDSSRFHHFKDGSCSCKGYW